MRIAIIGSGISGLGAAYLLNPDHEIVLYEQNDYLGGHARTRTVQYLGKKIAVDTGFIVFNYRNYPHLTGMFSHLDVPVKLSDMSFAASLEDGAFEYSSKNLSGMFPDFKSLFQPKRYRMLIDYFRFARAAKAFLKKESDISLDTLIKNSGVSASFADEFILPISAAIWSGSVQQMRQFPARTFVRFFENHGLLDVNGQPDWYTVDGGSQEYVKRVVEGFEDKIRLNTVVARVEPVEGGVEVTDATGAVERYDHAIIAAHSDQALAMLANPSHAQKAALKPIRYQENRAYLHRDTRLMPRSGQCWASWVFMADKPVDELPNVSVTYWMNLLQSVDEDCPLFVSLNPVLTPHEDLVFEEHVFMHPVYDADAIAAQKKVAGMQGENNIWFCGAWQRYGFHEDGLQSAVHVAKSLGAKVPW